MACPGPVYTDFLAKAFTSKSNEVNIMQFNIYYYLFIYNSLYISTGIWKKYKK